MRTGDAETATEPSVDERLVSAGQLAQRVAQLEHELSERRRAEALQRALYEIAALSSEDSGQHEHYARLHEIVGRLMYARNFIIATYDSEAGMIHQGYLVDEDPNEVSESFPFGEGISSLVLRTRLPWLMDDAMPVPRVSVKNVDRKPMSPRAGTMNSIRTQPVPWLDIVSMRPRRAASNWVTAPRCSSGTSMVMCSMGS